MSENGRSGREPVIVSAARTPIGRLGGSLAGATAPQLGAAAVRAAVERAGIPPEAVDEVIMGQVIQAGAGQAPARQAALRGGLPDTVGAVTVNKVCGSGLKAVMLASSCILAGEGDLYVAGGMESMSSAPYLLPDARRGARFGHVQALDSIVRDGLWCSFTEAIMGDAAEFIADQYEITRQEMDVFAIESHQKAIAAIDSGRFKREIVPVEVREGKTTRLVDTDEGPRRDTSLEALGRLRPAFRDEGGRVTAGNAPGLNDGAAALVVMAREQAERAGVRPIARIVGYTHAAVEPRWLFIGPARAVPRLLERIGWRLGDADLIEINEAFAAQVLADGKDLIAKGHAWDWARVNVNGGAVALGHPIGASGARVLVTLIHALQDRGGRRGLATLCLGGGEAVALAVELE